MKIKASPASLRAAKRLVEIANRHREDESDLHFSRFEIDADETSALALQFEQMLARVYEAPYTKLQTLDAVPMNTEVDADAESFAWEEVDRAGEAAFIDDGQLGDDLKSVEVKSSKQSRPIYTAGIAVNHTLADVRRAARSGKPLQARKLMLAREAFDRLVDRVTSVGDSSRGISYGVCNWAIGTGASQVRNTAATSADWASGATVAATMLADLLKAVSEMVADSEGTFAPDTLALPMHLRLRIAHTMFVDGRPESVLERFLRVNGTVKRVIDLNRLKDADGTGATQTRGLLMATSSANFESIVPMPFTVRPPQEVGLGVRMFAIGRVAGFVIYQPLSMRYITALPRA